MAPFSKIKEMRKNRNINLNSEQIVIASSINSIFEVVATMTPSQESVSWFSKFYKSVTGPDKLIVLVPLLVVITFGEIV